MGHSLLRLFCPFPFRLAKKNYKHGENLPVISVKRGSSNQYGYEVEVSGPCRVVYRPDQPKDCGAKVWIETLSEVKSVA